MLEKIGDHVSVNLVYDHTTGSVTPKHIKWKQAVYTIEKIGLHYTRYEGKTLVHMFSVCDAHHFFLLSFNTHSLHWRLEEIADDIPN